MQASVTLDYLSTGRQVAMAMMLLVALSAPKAWSAETVVLELPEGQFEVVREIPLKEWWKGGNSRSHSANVQVRIVAGGFHEFEARMVSDEIASMQVENDIVPGLATLPPDGSAREYLYRALVHHDKSFFFVIEAKEKAMKANGYISDSIQLTLRRADAFCTMTATVAGDVSRATLGDVAYFNFIKEGVKEGLASGTALDPTAHEALGGLTDFAQWATEFLEDDGEEQGENSDAGDDGEVLEPGPSTEEKPGSQLIWGDEWDLTGSDTFGLTLVGVRFDAAGPAPSATGEKDSDGFGGEILPGYPEAVGGTLYGMGVLGSTFSLSVSGRVVFDPYKDVGQAFKVDPSFVAVAPGVMDENVSGVKFLWEPGQPGGSDLEFRVVAPGVIQGRVKADLYSETEYENGRLRIEVNADFTALQHAVSCQ